MATQLTAAVVVNAQRFAAPSVPSFVDDISVPLSNGYPTGGYTGLEALLQVQTGDKRKIVDVVGGIGINGFNYAWDAANGALKLFVASTGVEVANNVDLSATTLRIRVLSE